MLKLLRCHEVGLKNFQDWRCPLYKKFPIHEHYLQGSLHPHVCTCPNVSAIFRKHPSRMDSNTGRHILANAHLQCKCIPSQHASETCWRWMHSWEKALFIRGEMLCMISAWIAFIVSNGRISCSTSVRKFQRSHKATSQVYMVVRRWHSCFSWLEKSLVNTSTLGSMLWQCITEAQQTVLLPPKIGGNVLSSDITLRLLQNLKTSHRTGCLACIILLKSKNTRSIHLTLLFVLLCLRACVCMCMRARVCMRSWG